MIEINLYLFLLDTLEVTLKEGVAFPSSVDDYIIQLNPLEGLEPEIIDGI